jgi:urea transport system substrate-binding protein
MRCTPSLRGWMVALATSCQFASFGCNKDDAKPTDQTKPMEPAASASGAAPKADTPAMAPGDTIKLGILHSLSGTMAISETSLRDVALMTIDELP